MLSFRRKRSAHPDFYRSPPRNRGVDLSQARCFYDASDTSRFLINDFVLPQAYGRRFSKGRGPASLTDNFLFHGVHPSWQATGRFSAAGTAFLPAVIHHVYGSPGPSLRGLLEMRLLEPYAVAERG
jgi:hypothetical protein